MDTSSYPVTCDLDSWSHHSWNNGVQIDALPELTHLIVRTRNSQYELIVVAARAGHVLVRGGQFFPEFERVRVAGSCLGGSFLKLHGIYVGFQLELHRDSDFIVTTKVRSIARVDSESAPVA